LGQTVDKMIVDDRFVSQVNEAHEAATLKKSRMLALARMLALVT